ncbi:MAG TPA: hypothetical protein GYA07_05200, partial [Verrucomicrobia bacterium]|nr:hypothetical protein [Verrucomicrobiota bacterium]
MPLISMFRNVHSKTPMKDVEAETIFEDFRNGKWKEPVEDIRRRYREAIGQGMSPDAAKDAIAPLKKKLPAVTFSGRAAKRGNEGIEAHSGLLCIDLDDLGDDVQGIKSRLRKSPHLRFAAISPSGTGVKAIFRVPAHIEAHRKHFLGLHHHVRELLKDDTAIDNSCRDVGRLCFVTYDPEAIDNPEAAEFSAADLSYSSASLHSTSLHPYIPATLHPLHNNGDVLANIREAARAKKALAAKNPRLVKLYVDFVESRFTAAPGGRNEFLTRSIP